jgi:putative DNA primase/helicase
VDLPADPTLRARIRAGRDGQHEAALAWIVEGAMRWAAAGEVMPKAPQAIQDSTREWRGTTDVLGRFLEEMTELDEGCAVKAQEFYEAFAAWCETYGHRAWGDQLLWERFRGHDWMTSGTVTKPPKSRLGGRRLSSRALHGAAAPAGPSRYVFGLRFTGDTRG